MPESAGAGAAPQGAHVRLAYDWGVDPVADFARYLEHIDWLLAIATAAIAIAIVAIAWRVLEPFGAQIVELGRGARLWVTRRVIDRRADTAGPSWVCPDCHSINPPAAARCYRGCGERPPDAALPDANELAVQHGGRTGRRG